MTGRRSPAPDEADRELVARAVGGDTHAFERLYRDNVGRVYALCLRMCGDRSSAEELTQISFVRAWERLRTFQGRSAFSSWLHRVAVNVVLGAGRQQSRRSQDEPLSEQPRTIDASHRPDRERDLDLERAIRGLPDRAREVFVLHDVEGYRHDEIAALTGMAVGTSRAHLHRARRLLREALSP